MARWRPVVEMVACWACAALLAGAGRPSWCPPWPRRPILPELVPAVAAPPILPELVPTVAGFIAAPPDPAPQITSKTIAEVTDFRQFCYQKKCARPCA